MESWRRQGTLPGEDLAMARPCSPPCSHRRVTSTHSTPLKLGHSLLVRAPARSPLSPPAATPPAPIPATLRDSLSFPPLAWNTGSNSLPLTTLSDHVAPTSLVFASRECFAVWICSFLDSARKEGASKIHGWC